MNLSPENKQHRARQDAYYIASRRTRALPDDAKLEPVWTGQARRRALGESPPRVQRQQVVPAAHRRLKQLDPLVLAAESPKFANAKPCAKCIGDLRGARVPRRHHRGCPRRGVSGPERVAP